MASQSQLNKDNLHYIFNIYHSPEIQTIPCHAMYGEEIPIYLIATFDCGIKWRAEIRKKQVLRKLSMETMMKHVTTTLGADGSALKKLYTI